MVLIKLIKGPGILSILRLLFKLVREGIRAILD